MGQEMLPAAISDWPVEVPPWEEPANDRPASRQQSDGSDATWNRDEDGLAVSFLWSLVPSSYNSVPHKLMSILNILNILNCRADSWEPRLLQELWGRQRGGEDLF